MDTRPSPVADYAAFTLDKLGAMYERLGEICELLRAIAPRDPHTRGVTFSATPTTLSRDGYRHLRIWANASATLTVDTPAGKSMSYSLAAGWNTPDFPDESTATAAAATNAVLEWTDYDS